MTDSIYPNRELVMHEDGETERSLIESFLDDVHKGDNISLTSQLNPILKRNRLPNGSEAVSIVRPNILIDVRGKVQELDSKYVQMLTSYRKVRGVPYTHDGRRYLGLRLARIPLKTIVDYQSINGQ